MDRRRAGHAPAVHGSGIAALNRAADLGFRDAARLKSDDDLWVLRQEPGFNALVERLQKSP